MSYITTVYNESENIHDLTKDMVFRIRLDARKVLNTAQTYFHIQCVNGRWPMRLFLMREHLFGTRENQRQNLDPECQGQAQTLQRCESLFSPNSQCDYSQT